ncbi:MAG: hypothetical protein LBG73_05765 [Spirochaetaceae bacterium]|jgi:hypothetical protein|nr:hypothetical protein [Spirochaetaceae bacterium]
MKKKTAGFGAFTLLLALITAGCPSESPSDPKPAGEITITDIPTTIGDGGPPSYKIYVSLSDYATDDQPHKAQGTALLNGASSAKIMLYNPPPASAGIDPDPDNQDGGVCSVTAKYFSVTISPQTVSTSDDIIIKPGTGFNESKKNISWEGLMQSSFILDEQRTAIFNRIICKDDAITHP